jgi:hypothetical protein
VRLRLVIAVIGLASLATVSARGHVAPSLDVNNRYLKLTPMRDRLRLAYTIYLGEQPGAQLRQRLDRDRDGLLSEDETGPFVDELAGRVVAGLEVTFDGQPRTVTWALRDIGLGTPATDAGAFSVDLIAYICAPTDGEQHQLVLFDRFEMDRAGETEIRIEESPGVRVTRATLGEHGPSMLSMKWNGNRGPTALDGLHLAFEVGDDADPTDDLCAGGGPAPRSARGDADRPLLLYGGAAAGGLALVAVALLAVRKRRRGT